MKIGEILGTALSGIFFAWVIFMVLCGLALMTFAMIMALLTAIGAA